MFDLFIASSMEKIMPERHYNGKRTSNFSALKGETVSFLVVFACDEQDIYNFKFECATLDEIKAYFVKNVPVNYAAHKRSLDDKNYISHEPGLFPDLLEPADRNWAYVNDIYHSIWITVKPKAGDHCLSVNFTDSDGNIAATASAKIHIIDLDIPKQELIYTQWFHVDCLADYYGYQIFSEELWDMTEKYLRTAYDNGINMILTPIFTPPLDTAVGHERSTVQLVKIMKDAERYTFDFSLLRRWISICQNIGFEYFEMPHLFAQWGVEATPKITAIVDGKEKEIFGWHTKPQSVEYDNFLAQFLPALINELKTDGIFGNTYFHITDEPVEDKISSYDTVKKIALKYLSGCKIIDAVSEIAANENMVGIPIPSTTLLARKQCFCPKERWCYYCNADCVGVSNRFVAMPSARNRSIGFQLYKFKIHGFLHWGYNFYYSRFSLLKLNPFLENDAYGAFPSGDSVSVYPGKDGPLPSIGLMVFNEALQDLRALKLLESYIGYDAVIDLLEHEVKSEIKFDRCFSADDLISARAAVNKKLECFCTASVNKIHKPIAELIDGNVAMAKV